MKTDLASSIGIAIVGVIVSYFICNLFLGPIEDVDVKTVDASITAEVAEPNPEVFNYRAINPTVEVYVGNSDTCDEINEQGECVGNTSVSDNTNQGNP